MKDAKLAARFAMGRIPEGGATMGEAVYTLDEISERTAPVFSEYGVGDAWVFGSYARGEAEERSDVDVIMDASGSDVSTLGDVEAVREDLEGALNKSVDLVLLDALERPAFGCSSQRFLETVNREKVLIHAAR